MAGVNPIVPPGSTELERVVDTTFPHGWSALADSAEPAATGIHPRLLPWIAQQWQVTAFAPYFDSVDALLQQAVPWLMERGSIASVRRALGWLGYVSVTIDEAGAWLHIDPGRVIESQDMAALVHVVRASLPAHVRLYRVYHGHDARPIVLDRGPRLDAGLLDAYSGVPGQYGVLESFGQRTGATLPMLAPGEPGGASTQARVSISRYDDMPVLDAWRLDSRILAALSGGEMALTTYVSSVPPVGGGARARSQAMARVCAWVASATVGATTHTTRWRSGPPVHPPRQWGGRWGGSWRGHFQLITHKET